LTPFDDPLTRARHHRAYAATEDDVVVCPHCDVKVLTAKAGDRATSAARRAAASTASAECALACAKPLGAFGERAIGQAVEAECVIGGLLPRIGADN
jgi:hypothetical protein